MSRLKTPDELEIKRKAIIDSRDPGKPCITICGGTGCLALGSGSVIDAFKQEIETQGIGNKVDLRITGCHGFCEKGPHVLIRPQGVLYQRVKVEDVAEIVSEAIIKGNVIARLLYVDPNTGKK